MDKPYRRSGATFSTSGRPWLPFKWSPKVGRYQAKLHRLIKSEKFKPTLTKAEQRQEAEIAATLVPIKRLRPGSTAEVLRDKAIAARHRRQRRS